MSSIYSYCRFFVFLTTYSASFNLLKKFWFSCWTLVNCPLIVTNSLSWFLRVYCIVFSYKLQVCRWLLVSNIFSLVCSYSTLRLASSCNVPNQVVTLWATYSKNILICFKLFVKWLEIRTSWVIEKYGFFTWIGSTTSWTGCDDYTTATIGCLGSTIDTTCWIGSIGSTWMLSITWSRLGSSYSSKLPCIIVVWTFFPPPPPIPSE